MRKKPKLGVLARCARRPLINSCRKYGPAASAVHRCSGRLLPRADGASAAHDGTLAGVGLPNRIRVLRRQYERLGKKVSAGAQLYVTGLLAVCRARAASRAAASVLTGPPVETRRSVRRGQTKLEEAENRRIELLLDHQFIPRRVPSISDVRGSRRPYVQRRGRERGAASSRRPPAHRHPAAAHPCGSWTQGFHRSIQTGRWPPFRSPRGLLLLGSGSSVNQSVVPGYLTNLLRALRIGARLRAQRVAGVGEKQSATRRWAAGPEPSAAAIRIRAPSRRVRDRWRPR